MAKLAIPSATNYKTNHHHPLNRTPKSQCHTGITLTTMAAYKIRVRGCSLPMVSVVLLNHLTRLLSVLGVPLDICPWCWRSWTGFCGVRGWRCLGTFSPVGCVGLTRSQVVDTEWVTGGFGGQAGIAGGVCTGAGGIVGGSGGWRNVVLGAAGELSGVEGGGMGGV
ncbi:hypothetical protein Tco_0143400 [Tanacetum coccineum]